MSEADTEKTIEDLGERAAPGDGLESDAEGRVYIGDYEHDSIHRRNTDGSLETLVSDPRILWPDTLTVATMVFCISPPIKTSGYLSIRRTSRTFACSLTTFTGSRSMAPAYPTRSKPIKTGLHRLKIYVALRYTSPGHVASYEVFCLHYGSGTHCAMRIRFRMVRLP